MTRAVLERLVLPLKDPSGKFPDGYQYPSKMDTAEIDDQVINRARIGALTEFLAESVQLKSWHLKSTTVWYPILADTCVIFDNVTVVSLRTFSKWFGAAYPGFQKSDHTNQGSSQLILHYDSYYHASQWLHFQLSLSS